MINQAKPVAPDQTEKEHKLNALKKESEKLLLDIKHIGKEEKEEMKIEAEKDSHLNESERETVNEFRKELKVEFTSVLLLFSFIMSNYRKNFKFVNLPESELYKL